jgi:hypothetical protein
MLAYHRRGAGFGHSTTQQKQNTKTHTGSCGLYPELTVINQNYGFIHLHGFIQS